MPPAIRRSRPPVELNASSLRELIRSQSVDIQALADELLCDRSYLSKLQRGDRPRCSPAFFARLCTALHVPPISLMRYPDQGDGPAVTGEMARPADSPMGPPAEVTAGHAVPAQRCRSTVDRP